MSDEFSGALRAASIVRVRGGVGSAADDWLAVEAPLQIVVEADGVRTDLAVTMRTPGNDAELAVGFLYTEDIVTGPREIAAVDEREGVVTVTLAHGVAFDVERIRRNVFVSSSCGVCGKASVDAVAHACPTLPPPSWRLDPATLATLPEPLRDAQSAFDRTGGVHACALFTPEGALIRLREDVGRHNALDKLIGAAVLAGETLLSDCVLLVSGRASFELVQKAAMAGIPVLAAIGAPSSLAVETAGRVGMTLVGFVRSDRFNLYTHPGRVAAK